MTNTGMPADLSARIVSSRLVGVAARGSMMRDMVRSSVVIDTPVLTSPFSAIGPNISMSR